MNKRQAAAIRAAQLRGEPVKAIELQEAISVLSSKRHGKMRLPRLSPDVTTRVNMVLMFNLGRAIGGGA
jgi:hypothetical protein